MKLCKEIGRDNPVRPKSVCKSEKNYGRQSSYTRCSACESSISKYGISTPQKLAMLEEQDYSCAICVSYIEFVQMKAGVNPKHRAVVDHCHSTGDVRGILCTSCNLMLGNGYDDPAILRAGAEYLEESQ